MLDFFGCFHYLQCFVLSLFCISFHKEVNKSSPFEHSQCPAVNGDILGGRQEVEREECHGQRHHVRLLSEPGVHPEGEQQHADAEEVLCRHQPSLSPTHTAEIQSIHYGCPHQFQTERPVNETKFCLKLK